MTSTRITRTEEEAAATYIACRWLNFAQAVIADNGIPAKLSETVERSIHGLYEANQILEGRKFNYAANARIAKEAIKTAALFLNNGDFPIVLAYFKNAAK
jgi:hypothetical protein